MDRTDRLPPPLPARDSSPPPRLPCRGISRGAFEGVDDDHECREGDGDGGGGLPAAGKSTESGEARETVVGGGRGADDDGGDRLRYAAGIKHD